MPKVAYQLWPITLVAAGLSLGCSGSGGLKSGTGGATGSSGSSSATCGCSAACCSVQASASSTTLSGGLTCPDGTYCYGSYYCDLAAGGSCTATDPCNGQSGTYTACGSSSGSSGSSSSSSSGSSRAPPTGSIGPQGGTMSSLSFAIVGDTRPQKEGDTAAYPTQLITEIFSNLQGASPWPQFVMGTGDYAYCSSSDCAAQTANYIVAAAQYTGQIFLAMGNHECTGATDSNCGPEGADGITPNYSNFLNLIGTFGLNSTNQPTLANQEAYYEVDVSSSDSTNPWTAKFVVIAANAWDSGQSSWLTSVMQKQTTYTFVIRHESYQDDGAASSDLPGDERASDQIIDSAPYPYTMLLVGHSHYYEQSTSGNGNVELIVGNGGAETSGPAGYVICSQIAGGNISCQPYASGTTPTFNGPAVVVNPAGALQ